MNDEIENYQRQIINLVSQIRNVKVLALILNLIENLKPGE